MHCCRCFHRFIGSGTLLISGFAVFGYLMLPAGIGITQERQKSPLETLEGIFRPRRRPAGTRGPICLITPGLSPEQTPLSQIPVILSDRPLFLWERPVTRVEIRSTRNGAVVWQHRVQPDRRSVVYRGTPLQPGETYSVVAFGRQNQPLNAAEYTQFKLLDAQQRQRLTAILQQRAAELKHKAFAPEDIAIAQAIELTQNALFSDAFERLYSLPQRSPKLTAFLTTIATQVCQL
jgi:hypothetical protein